MGLTKIRMSARSVCWYLDKVESLLKYYYQGSGDSEIAEAPYIG